jgi:galactokinase
MSQLSTNSALDVGSSLDSHQSLRGQEITLQAYRHHFSTDAPVRLFYAPGRVNLIGEHTDYNDGFVLPMAIHRGTWVAGEPQANRILTIHSVNQDETVQFDLDQPEAPDKGHWANYVLGMALTLDQPDTPLRGANLTIYGNVPPGAGLSSSASLECSTGYALLALSGYPVDPIQLALSGQATEHRYVGTQCGIMDQFIASLGQAGHALLIDCQSLEAEPVPLELNDCSILLCDSKVKHSLADSAYNRRRLECRTGVELLQSVHPDIRSLRDVDEAMFETSKHVITEITILQRVRHVVTENARTLEAAQALKQGDLAYFGELMKGSHVSLSRDYEVSCPELDMLVETANRLDGVLGARMTGGGFGGCTVNLIRTSQAAAIQMALRDSYQKAFHQTPEFYITQAERGAHEVQLM